MARKQTVNAHPSAPGMVAVYEETEMVLAIWAYSVESVSTNPKGVGLQIGMKTGSWFPTTVSVAEFTSALGAAMQMYIKEERLLKSVKAA